MDVMFPTSMVDFSQQTLNIASSSTLLVQVEAVR